MKYRLPENERHPVFHFLPISWGSISPTITYCISLFWEGLSAFVSGFLHFRPQLWLGFTVFFREVLPEMNVQFFSDPLLYIIPDNLQYKLDHDLHFIVAELFFWPKWWTVSTDTESTLVRFPIMSLLRQAHALDPISSLSGKAHLIQRPILFCQGFHFSLYFVYLGSKQGTQRGPCYLFFEWWIFLSQMIAFFTAWTWMKTWFYLGNTLGLAKNVIIYGCVNVHH